MLNKEFYPKEQLALNPGIDPNVKFGTISSGDLTSAATPIPVVTPPQTPITIPESEDFKPPEIKPIQEESDISKMIKDITGGRTALAGESFTFQAEEEKRLGTEKLATEEADLFSQLKQQQAEFENLQAEDVRIEERMQQQAAGRGITAGGLQPLTAAELRKNFLIKSEKAAEVNVTAAILAGTQNKLLTAKLLVENAIKNKFGAREAQLNAETENLKLLLQDPTLTIAQTNRANAQIAKKEKEKEDMTKKKEDSKKILDWSVEARQNGASALEAQEIANIGLSDNPDLGKAFEIYSKYAKKEEKPIGDIAEFKAFFPNVDVATTAGREQFLDWSAKVSETKRVPVVAPSVYIPGSNPAVDNWARLIISGQAKITEVPNPKGSTLRSDVINAISSGGQLLLSDKDREKLSTLDTAFNVYETIKGLSEKINTFGVGGRVAGYLSRYIGGATQFNTDIARYNATRKGFVSNVARTLGEKGTLAEGDVQRAINNLPTTNDTKAVAEGKLETLRKILQGAKDSIIQKSTEPLTGTTSGTILGPTPDNLRTKYSY